MAKVKLLKDGITVGTHTHVAGDVVDVPDRRADQIVKYGEGQLVADVPAAKRAPGITPPIETAKAPVEAAERATSPRQK
jgi:hypothetical protein